MLTESTKRLVSVVQELSIARGIDRVMEIVRKAARDLTGADGATFVLRENDVCYYAEEDAISPLWKGNRFPIKTCISGWAMLNRKAVVIEDIYLDDRIPHDVYRPTFVKSLVMVPIRTMDPIGAIGNYWAEKYSPSADQLILLQSLADITAVTIENVNVYNELEMRVQERTRQLEMVNKELEAFSYSVSHDLRAPLRSIAGYADMLRHENFDHLNSRGKMALNTIEENVQRMNKLIDDLLWFSRMGQRDLEMQTVDSAKLVNEVIRSLPLSGVDRPQIHINTLSTVMGDRTLLFQVWENLLSNAIKYSSKIKNPVIEVGSYLMRKEIIFFVRDNGAGFDMRYADKLFAVFQRLHHHDEFDGTGIGLALVKRIVNRHNGRTWAEGKVNEGATFYFSLPNKAGG